jgi:electron transport complex protein RnfA
MPGPHLGDAPPTPLLPSSTSSLLPYPGRRLRARGNRPGDMRSNPAPLAGPGQGAAGPPGVGLCANRRPTGRRDIAKLHDPQPPARYCDDVTGALRKYKARRQQWAYMRSVTPAGGDGVHRQRLGDQKASMKEYALILVSTVLVNNFVLVKFLGLCPFMGVSRKLETAMGMGLATTFVLTLSSVSSYLVNAYILVPLGVEFLRTIAFILVIAVVVQFTEMVMHKTSPLLYQVLGIFLPLITTNCAVLGVALLNIQEQHSFVASALYGFGAAIGFSLVLVLFAAVRERVAVADVPEPFQGNAIALVTAGLMSMAFMGFAGLVSG